MNLKVAAAWVGFVLFWTIAFIFEMLGLLVQLPFSKISYFFSCIACRFGCILLSKYDNDPLDN